MHYYDHIFRLLVWYRQMGVFESSYNEISNISEMDRLEN